VVQKLGLVNVEHDLKLLFWIGYATGIGANRLLDYGSYAGHSRDDDYALRRWGEPQEKNRGYIRRQQSRECHESKSVEVLFQFVPRYSRSQDFLRLPYKLGQQHGE
jgi:hypothetical protein